MLAAIGLFILLLACINFVNLTTARQADRAREVGIRKTIGAGYRSLVGQFMGESMVLVFLSGLMALLLMGLLLPSLNDIAEKTLALSLLVQPVTVALILGFLLVTGLLAGWYPALLLAKYKPVDTLKGQIRTDGRGRGSARSGSFSVLHFPVADHRYPGGSAAGAVHAEPELGFNKERVLVVELRKAPRRNFYENRESVKEGLRGLANVQSVSGAAGLPGRGGWEGQLVVPEGRPQEQAITMEVIPVDHHYVKTIGLQIKAGRDYSEQFSTDAESGVLINESAAKAFGWTPEEAIGKGISTAGMEKGKVIGVLADYHQHGLQRKIEPVLTFIQPFHQYVAVRLGPGELPGTVAGWRATGSPASRVILSSISSSTKILTSSTKQSSGWLGCLQYLQLWPLPLPALACLALPPSWPKNGPKKLASVRCWALQWVAWWLCFRANL